MPVAGPRRRLTDTAPRDRFCDLVLEGDAAHLRENRHLLELSYLGEQGLEPIEPLVDATAQESPGGAS